MTDDEMRIAIAEVCGWTLVAERLPVVYSGSRKVLGIPPDKYGKNSEWDMDAVPDYLNDLNAMHEVENLWATDFKKMQTYYHELAKICGGWDVFRATARQRAEAFLRVTRPEKFQ